LSFFLPDFEKKALEALCDSLDQAQETIVCALFTLTHPLLIEKLIAAKKRGVHVFLAIDRNAAHGSSRKALERLKEAGISILKGTNNTLLHHKWAWIDQRTFIVGSANWTQAAFEKNQDFILVLNHLHKKEQKALNRLWKRLANTCEKG